jgi:hypothetical protein
LENTSAGVVNQDLEEVHVNRSAGQAVILKMSSGALRGSWSGTAAAFLGVLRHEVAVLRRANPCGVPELGHQS